MFKSALIHAQSAILRGDHSDALTWLEVTLPLAARGRQWAMTMTAIKFTRKTMQ